MKRVQHTHNSTDTKKIERLISTTKNKEKGKKTEQVLIMGIVLFCLSMLYFVFTINNDTEDNGRNHNAKNQLFKESSKHQKTTSSSNKQQ